MINRAILDSYIDKCEMLNSMFEDAYLNCYRYLMWLEWWFESKAGEVETNTAQYLLATATNSLVPLARSTLVQHLFDRFHGVARGRVRAAIDDDALSHRTQPRQLTFAELPRRKDSLIAHRCGIDRSVEVFPRLPVTHTAHRGHRRIEIPARAQRGDFIDEAGRKHRIETSGDSLVQHAAIGGLQRYRHEPIRRCFAASGRRGEQR